NAFSGPALGVHFSVHQTTICRLYCYAIHTNYCSYYALDCPAGTPINWDDVCGASTTSGCGSGEGCTSSGVLRTSDSHVVSERLARDGFGQGTSTKLPEWNDGSALTGLQGNFELLKTLRVRYPN